MEPTVRERRADGQADKHVHPRLHLIHVAGEARNEQFVAHRAILGLGQAEHMAEQVFAQAAAEALCAQPQNTGTSARRQGPPHPAQA